MASLAGILAEKKQYQDQLEIVLGQLRDDAENSELLALEGELKDLIGLLDESIAELQPKTSAKPAAEDSTQPSRTDKRTRDSHPTSKKPAEEKEEPPVHYTVNDTVLAKWISGDRSFYPARITSITGSSNAPIYIVKFKNYDNIMETLRSKDIRPISNKRKAEGPPSTAATLPAVVPTPGLVSSAGATLYPEAKKDAEKDADATKNQKPKKIKAKKELEAGKAKWQEFNAKSKIAKSKKKESMFRTPEGIHGRVGFTGSGQAMRKDQARTRHVYQVNDDLDN